MKKALIISYHALPLDVVASYRAKAYCDYLAENEIFPTLVTHRWEKNEQGNWRTQDSNDEIHYEKHRTHHEIRLPRPAEELYSKSPLHTLTHWLKGDFDMHLLQSAKVFTNFLFSHLAENRYDCVIAIFSPHFHLKLAHEIHREFKIPYILDFRDLWDNQVITKSYKPNFKKATQDLLIQCYWKKWLKGSLFFTTTSDKWIGYINRLSGTRGIKVTNGHGINEVSSPKRTDKFRLAYFGRMYPYQNFEVIIQGINNFLNRNQKIKDFEILLIGIKKVNEFDGAKVFKNKIHSGNVSQLDYMAKEDLLKYSEKNVSIFILPNLTEDNGSFFVKLYDFIALNKPIILAPENGSENDRVVKESNAGLISSSPKEISNFIEDAYNEYKMYGKISSNISFNMIHYFQRSTQVKFMADAIKNHLK